MYHATMQFCSFTLRFSLSSFTVNWKSKSTVKEKEEVVDFFFCFQSFKKFSINVRNKYVYRIHFNKIKLICLIFVERLKLINLISPFQTACVKKHSLSFPAISLPQQSCLCEPPFSLFLQTLLLFLCNHDFFKMNDIHYVILKKTPPKQINNLKFMYEVIKSSKKLRMFYHLSLMAVV